MKWTRAIACATVTAATVVAMTPGVARADLNQSKPCTAVGGGNAYSAKDWIHYQSYSSSLWQINKLYYRFGPSNPSSIHNNQNIAFFGGSNWYYKNSPDALVRDGVAHSWFDGRSVGLYGQKAKSHVTFTNIIDVPSADDPSCVTTIYL